MKVKCVMTATLVYTVDERAYPKLKNEALFDAVKRIDTEQFTADPIDFVENAMDEVKVQITKVED